MKNKLSYNELFNLLKKYEWVDTNNIVYDGIKLKVCPECHQTNLYGHKEDCRLSKILTLYNKENTNETM